MAFFGNKPEPPPRKQLPPPSDYAPRPRRLSDVAAQAAQNVEDLENALRASNQERDEFRVQIAVLVRENEAFAAKLATAEAERDAYKDRVTNMEARISDARETLGRILAPDPYKPKASVESLEAGIGQIVRELKP